MILALTWTGLEEWLAEHARVELRDDGMLATGVQLGVQPQPYRAEYLLEAPSGWVTRRLEVEVSGADFRRHLVLERDFAGAWVVDGTARPDLAGALDCDLAYSPLTNAMPVRRHRLDERDGSHDFAMAWVSLPDLEVHLSPQRYEHVRPRLVRFIGLDSDFTSELEFSDDGLVVRYPRLATRVAASE